MTGHSAFTDAELQWLAKTEKVGANLPDDALTRLARVGVVDRTDQGPEITGLGRLVLDEARINRRLPLRRM